MRASSCKAKGRRACQEAKEAFLRFAPELSADDILVTSSGTTGEDLVFSPLARRIYNFSVEGKNVEKLNVWEALAQAEAHAAKRKGSIPLLIFRRNRSNLMVSLSLEDFLKLTQGVRSERGHDLSEVSADMLDSVSSVLPKGKV